MKTLIIHPKDTTTDFLSDIYISKDHYTIIRYNASKKELIQDILEHDRIIMLGHGTEYGLFGFGRYIIDSDLVYLLKNKFCICIWCNANKFVNKYKLNGFYTGMFISEYSEAVDYSIVCTDEDIQESNHLFANLMNTAIEHRYIKDFIMGTYTDSNNIMKFNRDRFYQNFIHK